MGWMNKHKKEWNERKAQRYALEGRKFEQEELPKILQKMLDGGKIVEFEIHTPNSSEDTAGQDARVRALNNEQPVDKYFGVTRSLRSWKEAERMHPHTPQFCFPIGTKPETIEKRILQLFGASL